MKTNRALATGLALWLIAGVATGSEEDVLARVAGEPVTVANLREYARLNPVFFTQLQVPGGPRKVLDNLINERLLVLEGERRGIPRPAADPSSDVAYVYAVRNRLVEPCTPADEAGVQAFYQEHLDRFSTPLFLRLRRLVLPAGDDPKATAARLTELKGRIEAGQAEFAGLADEMSIDPLGRGRGGDLGFQPVDGSDPLVAELARLPKGGFHGPVPQGGYIALYQVTDRREPIPEPYASARGRVAEEQLRQCKEAAFARLLRELKAQWPVEMYVQEIGVAPQAPPAERP